VISSLISLDQTIFLTINSFNLQWLNPVMVFFSGEIIWIPLLISPFFLAWNKTTKKEMWLFGLFLLLVLTASDVTSSYILKNIFTRLRPCREADLLPLIHQFGQKCGGKFGFVSSHAANSFALVIYSISSRHESGRWRHLLWLMPLIVSFSRIYLGVHYPGDILAGALVGLFWGSFFAWVFRNSKVPV
jgi:undecaprenyl-diphosphatase